MNFPKENWRSYFFQKCVDLFSFLSLSFFSFNQFLSSKIFLEKVCNLGKVGNRDYILSKGIQGVRMKIHKTSLFFFGISDKPLQSTYDNMLKAVKLIKLR